MVVKTSRDPVVGPFGRLATTSTSPCAASPLTTTRSAPSLACSFAVSSSTTTPLTSQPSTLNKCALSFILSCSPSSPVERSGDELGKVKYPLKLSCNSTSTRTRPNYSSRASRPDKYTTITTRLNHSTTSTNSTLLMTKGTRFCIADGCMSLAKHNQRCWRHGGSIKCKVLNCDNRAKSKGVCWSHGGGTRCRFEKCSTIAVSKGFCWAHGGGKRCLKPRCSRPGYERTQNYCATHFKALASGRNQAVEYAF